jgi:hypothetical protein
MNVSVEGVVPFEKARGAGGVGVCVGGEGGQRCECTHRTGRGTGIHE